MHYLIDYQLPITLPLMCSLKSRLADDWMCGNTGSRYVATISGTACLEDLRVSRRATDSLTTSTTDRTTKTQSLQFFPSDRLTCRPICGCFPAENPTPSSTT